MTAGAQVSFYRRAKDALATPGLPEKISERPPGSWPVVTPHLRVSPTARPCEDEARAIRARVIAHLDQHPDPIRGRTAAPRRPAALGCDGRRCGSDRHRAGAQPWRAIDRQGQVHAQRGDRAERRTRGHRHPGGGNGPGGVRRATLGEAPSHIIGPIIHKSREDVAAVFRERLGATDDDVSDVSRMTALARRTLRRSFCARTWGSAAATSASWRPEASSP